MGKRTASAETLKPDPIYGSKLASKFINCLMWQGKKATAQRIFYDAMGQIQNRMKDVNPIQVFETAVENGDVYRSATVVITAGGTPVKLEVPGELEYAGKGVSYCAICDGAFFKEHTIAVVGGGDAACEEADFLTRYAAKVYLIHRRDEFRASRIVQQRLFANPKIEIVRDTVVEAIVGEGGLMTAATLRHVKSGARRDLAATGIFIFIGFTPNTGIIDGHVEHDATGYLLTDSNMQTSIPGLFAAGDVRVQLT